MSVDSLFNLLPEDLKLPSNIYTLPIKFPELSKSLDKYGYAPDKFTYIKIKNIKKQQTIVVNGKKRILLLYLKNPKKYVKVYHLRPFKRVN